ncbi:sacsin-like, partial [Patella vulgata]|uniref:sacsin-like n=1 Tax=Patella vulgata TaxID=6465 RepID=UPI0024A9AD46
RSVAELMGVKSKRSHDIENVSSPLFSEFGQHEDLTNRIKGILQGYPCDESILKELLQNADDAGATEVIFIKDFRQLETNSLPDDKLSQIQGPALCIYNNTCFSERDLNGIQALGSGSKRDEMLKTGQYGVGFNVVYHVTDVPSFWSKGSEIGELVCICDPHCKYLQSATGRTPGSKIKVSGLRGRYTDFMEGYLPKFTNKLDKGTLFRLPLRTEDMAANSEIRSEQTTTQDIEDIITLLKGQISPCMIFLENITKIKIASVDQNGDLIIEHEISLSGEVNGNAYCTLPLPIQTGLPVHINGQFTLDHESRRNLRCEKDSVEGQWNEHLAKYVIVPAYISALTYIKE